MEIENLEKFEIEYNGNIFECFDSNEIKQKVSQDAIFRDQYISSILSDNTTDFIWSNRATSLLIRLYKERRQRFRNPLLRKKLWKEIEKEFRAKGYLGITRRALVNKLRNLKKSSITKKITTARFVNEDREKNSNSNSNSNSFETKLSSVIDLLPEFFFDTFPIHLVAESVISNVANSVKTSLLLQTLIEDGGPQSDSELRQLEILQEGSVKYLEELSTIREAIEKNNAAEKAKNDILRKLIEKL